MTDGLKRIAAYYDEFCQSVEVCRAAAAASYRSLDWKAAYSALGRMRDRYRHERGGLALGEQTALKKVFENDAFIEGLMDFRQVGEHVIRRGGPVIRTISNAPVRLTVESSAMAVFAGPVVVLPDITGAEHTIDHLKLLQEALRRIGAALERARVA
jgi:hypothetical protein